MGGEDWSGGGWLLCGLGRGVGGEKGVIEVNHLIRLILTRLRSGSAMCCKKEVSYERIMVGLVTRLCGSRRGGLMLL